MTIEWDEARFTQTARCVQKYNEYVYGDPVSTIVARMKRTAAANLDATYVHTSGYYVIICKKPEGGYFITAAVSSSIVPGHNDESIV